MKNDIRKSNPHGSDPAGVCESGLRHCLPGERWRLGDVCDDCAYDYDQISYGSAAEKAAAKKSLKARQAHSMRKNPAKRRRNPEPEHGKVMATTLADRRLLADALGCAIGELRGGKLTAAERDYRDRLQELYERVMDL